MKIAKKITSVLLAGVLCLSFAGCGNDSSTNKLLGTWQTKAVTSSQEKGLVIKDNGKIATSISKDATFYNYSYDGKILTITSSSHTAKAKVGISDDGYTMNLIGINDSGDLEEPETFYKVMDKDGNAVAGNSVSSVN